MTFHTQYSLVEVQNTDPSSISSTLSIFVFVLSKYYHIYCAHQISTEQIVLQGDN